MFARFGMTPVKPGAGPQMTRVLAEFAQRYQAMAGFKRLDILVDEERNEYGSFTLWETRAAAEAAAAAASPQIREVLGDLAAGPTTARIFEVYEPEA